VGTREPTGPPPPPTVQRLRIRYAKRGRLRFTSHRDIQRAFERALRRAGVPMAFSAGFSPHPKISWAGAAPTGTASEAEYLEIGVTARLDPAALRVSLDRALPPDLDVLEIVEAAGPGSLMDRLEASVWQIELPGVSAPNARTAVEKFLAAESVQVERLTKNGMRSFDARTAVLELSCPESGSNFTSPPCAILRVVVRHSTPAVRPDDVLTGLVTVAGLELPLAAGTEPSGATRPGLGSARVTRLSQGLLGPQDPAEHGATPAVLDPLTPDRNASV
jgi:radical SAM-linked protein